MTSQFLPASTPHGGPLATPDYRPRIVSWNVTAACHLSCPHCYLAAKHRLRGELTTPEALRVVDELAAAGTELLILTGGEPLLRRDLPELARRAADSGMNVVLGTTGTTIDRQRARVLKASGISAAGISIDSIDPAKHDRFRGMDGAWRLAVRGIEACIAEGIEVQIHTTAMSMNRDELPALVQFAHEKGAIGFHLFFLVCTGRGEQLTDLTKTEYEECLNFILDVQAKYPDMMVRARCAPYLERMARERGVPVPPAAGCLAATSYCRITPRGEVTPCPYLPTVAGNLRRKSFQEIWATSGVLKQFRRPGLVLQGRCGECAYSQGPEPICVGCRARAFAVRRDALGADPWCPFEPAIEIASSDPGTSDLSERSVVWTDTAQERLNRIPVFLRGRIKKFAETQAVERGLAQVTTELLSDLRARSGRAPRGRP